MLNDPVTGKFLTDNPNRSPDQLISVLQKIQAVKHCLSYNDIVSVAGYFGMSLCKVYSVASFYDEFKFEPIGKYHIRFCRGTACHIGASASLIALLADEYKMEQGKTTHNGLFSLDLCGCLGICGHAPSMMINETVYSELTPEKVRKIIDSILRREGVHA